MTTRLGNSSCLEQRGVIRFLLAESVKSCEILSRMQRQYGPSCMSRANFYKWVQAFKDGRESITDDLRSGRPVEWKRTFTISVNDEGVCNKIRHDFLYRYYHFVKHLREF